MHITTLFSILFLSIVASGPMSSAAVAQSDISAHGHEQAPGTRFEIQIVDTEGPGYRRLVKEIGSTYAHVTLQRASIFVLDAFKQRAEDGKGYTKVILTLERFAEEGTRYFDMVAKTRGNRIRLNSDYIAGYLGDVRKEYTGIVYHESARVWQWDGRGRAPEGLISGVADYIRLKAGWPSDKWVSRGSGSRWDEGYAVTAYFLEYCDSLRDGFVTELNAKMKYYYSIKYFEEILGRSVYDLWNEYKTRYHRKLKYEVIDEKRTPEILVRSVYDLWNEYKTRYHRKLKYEVIDEKRTPGDIRFQREIGVESSVRILERASEFVLKTLGQDKSYDKVTLIVESFVETKILPNHLTVAITVGNVIRLNSDYILYYHGRDLKAEVTGILYRECTHVWQWTGNHLAPEGLVNGIADYVRMKAGWESESWPKRGSGMRWDEGYAITAYFLEYCESLEYGFVAQLNALMKDGYSSFFFHRILGKNVNELWSDYKSKYAQYSALAVKAVAASKAGAPLVSLIAAAPAPAPAY